MSGKTKFILLSFALSLLLTGIAALIVSSPGDRALKREIAIYEASWRSLKADVDLGEKMMRNLDMRDGTVYSRLFRTEVPSADSLAVLIAGIDALPADPGNAFSSAMTLLKSRADSLPPLLLPLKGMSCAQTGASAGEKLNPFFKRPVRHRGIDLIAPEGTQVLCTAPGVVTSVGNTRDGLGMAVIVKHAGGYVTRYGRLGETFVEEGDKVKPGEVLGSVGAIHGFATHLHYEILLRDTVLDPVDYFFASVGPEDYAKMMYLSASIYQSME